MNIKQVMEAIGVLKAVPKEVLESISADASLEKAAQDLTAAEHVKDRWEQGQMNMGAQKEEIKTGPSEASSGGGAVHMVEHYSHPAKQNGTMITAESLSHILAPMAASAKAQTEAILSLIKSQENLNVSIAALVAKAEDDEDDEEEEEDESEVVEIKESKAKSLVTTSAKANHILVKSIVAHAKSYIDKAKKMGDDAKVEMDTEKKKMCRSKAKAALKTAADLLGKAASVASLAKLPELHKSVLKLALKSDINVVEDEEEDEEDEEEKAKAAKAAADARAKAEAKGNQADKQDPETGNQDDSAAKGEVLKQMSNKIDNALSGLGMLKTDVRGLMDVLMNTSKQGPGAVPPDFAKSFAVDKSHELSLKIEALEESGQMSPADALASQDIIAKANMVRLGQLTSSVLQDRIAKSSSAVQMLFRDAAA